MAQNNLHTLLESTRVSNPKVSPSSLDHDRGLLKLLLKIVAGSHPYGLLVFPNSRWGSDARVFIERVCRNYKMTFRLLGPTHIQFFGTTGPRVRLVYGNYPDVLFSTRGPIMYACGAHRCPDLQPFVAHGRIYGNNVFPLDA